MAELCGTVLLNGTGFDGLPWSVRAPLANLPDAAYETIREEIEAISQYAEEWEKSKR